MSQDTNKDWDKVNVEKVCPHCSEKFVTSDDSTEGYCPFCDRYVHFEGPLQ